MRDIRSFRKMVRAHYAANARSLPWRQTTDPCKIVVSEVMLQQTQVDRVVEKYELFIRAFPDFASLARASIGSVLRAWQGLGYNRRALLLKKLAERVVADYGGVLSPDQVLFEQLPGIDPASPEAERIQPYRLSTAFILPSPDAVIIVPGDPVRGGFEAGT